MTIDGFEPPEGDCDCADCHTTTAIDDGCEATDPPLCHECEKRRLKARIAELSSSLELEAASNVSLRGRIADLAAKLNTPETASFLEGVRREVAHQRERWGTDHDGGKEPSDWFWLIGYLAGKALAAHLAGNTEKALHHTISSAASLANWHAAILGKTNMRPGIAAPKDG